MQPPSVHGLRADLIPHREWPFRKWFYASPIWFYHRERVGERIVANERFYELVDPDLRELCYLLHQHGLLTTPSCQGHFYERQRFERIWQELSREAEQIASPRGLVVKDSETDQRYCFQDEQFALPWPDVDRFCAEAMRHQSTGYLGIMVPPQRDQVCAALASGTFEGDKASFTHEKTSGRGGLEGELFTCLVEPVDPTQRMELWRIVTDRVRGMLEPIPPVRDAADILARQSAEIPV